MQADMQVFAEEIYSIKSTMKRVKITANVAQAYINRLRILKHSLLL